MNLINVVRPTLFTDIDGTIVDTGTEEPLPFAVERINEAYDRGHMIILTTMRGSGFSHQSRLCCAETLRLLKSIGLKYHDILFNIPSPRIVINDEGAGAINHPTNSSWEHYTF
jgi:hypothetical protein